jgi:hypothetical protein
LWWAVILGRNVKFTVEEILFLKTNFLKFWVRKVNHSKRSKSTPLPKEERKIRNMNLIPKWRNFKLFYKDWEIIFLFPYFPVRENNSI